MGGAGPPPPPYAPPYPARPGPAGGAPGPRKRFGGGASSVSAKSRRRPRPPTSTPCRFRRADAAVSASRYSQKPKPLGLPVPWSKTRLRASHLSALGLHCLESWRDGPEGDDGPDGGEHLRNRSISAQPVCQELGSLTSMSCSSVKSNGRLPTTKSSVQGLARQHGHGAGRIRTKDDFGPRLRLPVGWLSVIHAALGSRSASVTKHLPRGWTNDVEQQTTKVQYPQIVQFSIARPLSRHLSQRTSFEREEYIAQYNTEHADAKELENRGRPRRAKRITCGHPSCRPSSARG